MKMKGMLAVIIPSRRIFGAGFGIELQRYLTRSIELPVEGRQRRAIHGPFTRTRKHLGACRVVARCRLKRSARRVKFESRDLYRSGNHLVANLATPSAPWDWHKSYVSTINETFARLPLKWPRRISEPVWRVRPDQGKVHAYSSNIAGSNPLVRKANVRLREHS
jgi:hypothetical protein